MKLRIIMADPAGNRTAIVRTPVPADQRAQIAAKILQINDLRAEQVGFETSALMGGIGRLEMMGGEFCGNAARSYGYLLWKEKQEAYLLQIPIGLRFRYFRDRESMAGLQAAAATVLSYGPHIAVGSLLLTDGECILPRELKNSIMVLISVPVTEKL